jgi:hypothetical protein
MQSDSAKCMLYDWLRLHNTRPNRQTSQCGAIPRVVQTGCRRTFCGMPPPAPMDNPWNHKVALASMKNRSHQNLPPKLSAQHGCGAMNIVVQFAGMKGHTEGDITERDKGNFGRAKVRGRWITLWTKGSDKKSPSRNLQRRPC